MRKKLIISVIIFAVLLVSIVFANSYVQALSRRQMNKNIQNSEICQNMEERMNNCDNICQQNENCPMYQQNDNCMRQNNHDWQRNCNDTRNCGRQQHHHNRFYNR